MRSHSRLSAESARRSADALTIARDWLATDDYVRCLRESYLRASPASFLWRVQACCSWSLSDYRTASVGVSAAASLTGSACTWSA